MRWTDTQVERSGANLSSVACSRHSGCFARIFLLGAAPTLAADRHVRVDVYYGRLSPRRKAWIDLIGCLVLMLPFCIFAFVTSLSFGGHLGRSGRSVQTLASISIIRSRQRSLSPLPC